jgi:flavin-binding protein dodecin
VLFGTPRVWESAVNLRDWPIEEIRKIAARLYSHPKENAMTDHHTYKKVELVGSSPTSIEDAINNALAEASKSLKLLEWFEVTETRGHIKDGKAAHFQVTLKVGFRIASS